MSDTEGFSSPPPIRPPSQRNGCVTAFMIIVGIVLLLPGACSLLFVLTSFSEVQRYFDSGVAVLILIVAALAAGGVFLIRAAMKGPRRT